MNRSYLHVCILHLLVMMLIFGCKKEEKLDSNPTVSYFIFYEYSQGDRLYSELKRYFVGNGFIEGEKLVDALVGATKHYRKNHEDRILFTVFEYENRETPMFITVDNTGLYCGFDISLFLGEENQLFTEKLSSFLNELDKVYKVEIQDSSRLRQQVKLGVAVTDSLCEAIKGDGIKN